MPLTPGAWELSNLKRKYFSAQSKSGIGQYQLSLKLGIAYFMQKIRTMPPMPRAWKLSDLK